MKTNLGVNIDAYMVKKLWKKWAWVCYPILVVVLIVTSFNYLFGAGGTWERVLQKRSRVLKLQEEAAGLERKVEELKRIDTAKKRSELELLNSIVPVTKDVGGLIVQLKSAAGKAGAVVEGYQGTVGEVASTASGSMDSLKLAVTLGVDSFSQLENVIGNLEKSLPVVRVSSVDYSNGKASLVIEGVWSPLASIAAGILGELPQSDKAMEQVAQLTAGMERAVTIVGNAVSESSSSADLNPF